MSPHGWRGRIFEATGQENLTPFLGFTRKLFVPETRHEVVDLIINDAEAERRAKKDLWIALALLTRISGFIVGKAIACGCGTPGAPLSLDTAHHLVSRFPTPSLVAQKHVGVKWKFTAWAKYPNFKLDEKIGSKMARAANAEEVKAAFKTERVVLEGGSIDVNGQGTLLTTEECLLSKVQQRNASLRREDYEEIFGDYLGIHKVIWLGNGIAGDDTHGHVDDITRFVAADTIVTMVELNESDVNHAPLADNLKAAVCERSKRPQAPYHRTAHARPSYFRRTAPAGKLRQLLHRERMRASSSF